MKTTCQHPQRRAWTLGTAAVVITLLACGDNPLAIPAVSLVNGSTLVGDTVRAARPTTIRSGPSLKSASVGRQPKGAVGTIVGGPVADPAGGSRTWWRIDFETGVDGWGSGQDFEKVGSAPAPVQAVIVSPTSSSVLVGDSAEFTATTIDLAGNALTGRTIVWATSDTTVARVDARGWVRVKAAGAATVTASSEGKSGSATVSAVVPASSGPPGTVTDLSVSAVTDTSASLSFTEVTDGGGGAAGYDLRAAVAPLSWGAAPSVARGTCSTPVVGGAVGARRTCTVLGLSPGTGYQFQVVAFRGTLDVDAVFGGLSNLASGTTVAPPPPPPPPPPPLGGSEPQPPASSLLIQNYAVGALAGGARYLYESYDRYSDNGNDVTLLASGNTHYGPTTARTIYYNTNYFSLVTGRGGSGLAIRTHYSSAGNEPLLQTSTALGSYTGAIVFSYYVRFPDASGFVNGSGWKFFEMWYAKPTLNGHNGRIQLGAYGDSRGFSFNPGWAPYDESRSGAEIGYQPVGPYPTDLNDGKWHRVTILYRPNTTNASGWNGSSFNTPSSRDGRAAAWIDGIKIVDISSATAGVTPAGGSRAWCSLADVDTLGGVNYAYIAHNQYPEYINGLTAPFNVDTDDLMTWTIP